MHTLSLRSVFFCCLDAIFCSRFKSDTSSDEICGHMAVYPLLVDVFAAEPEKQQRVLAVLVGILGGIVDHDLYLIDPMTGQRTTWGYWNPALLNDVASSIFAAPFFSSSSSPHPFCGPPLFFFHSRIS
jgi:hypothetical protein